MKIYNKYKANDILEIIKRENEIHPQAEYIDYYKLLFQAYFGQGHFIHDFKSAHDYLKEELAQLNNDYEPLIQDIGNGLGVFRFSLGLITEGLLSFDDFLSIFIRLNSNLIDWKTWSLTWNTISLIITSQFPILAQEQQIDFVKHVVNNELLCSHSERFRLTYKPHYRVVYISSKEFDLYPFMKDLL